MLHNTTPEKFKKRCTLIKTTKKIDKYGFEKVVESGENKTLFLLFQPISDKAVLEEYGIRYERSLQAAVFDDVKIRHFDLMKVDGENYTVIGIKKYPAHRLLILEKNNVQDQI